MSASCDAIKTGVREKVDDACAAFRFVVAASPDLIPGDAANLIKKVKRRVDVAFPQPEKSGIAGALGGTLSSKQAQMPANLGEIGLYD
jgi:hypothetical protein